MTILQVIKSPDERLKGWGDQVGSYRGSWLQCIPYSDEANRIAKAICAERDLWKQNETGEITRRVQQLLDEIEALK